MYINCKCFEILEYLMTDSQSEFSFRKEGSQQNSQTEQSKFPQSKRTKKRKRIST